MYKFDRQVDNNDNNTIQRNKGQTTCICFSIEILEYHMNNNRKKTFLFFL